jgi:hypothetical protein
VGLLAGRPGMILILQYVAGPVLINKSEGSPYAHRTAR